MNNNEKKIIQAISIDGGYINGFAQLGKVCQMEARKELDIKEVCVVAGCSSGALFAGLLATGWTPLDLLKEIYNTPDILQRLFEVSPGSVSVATQLYHIVTNGGGINRGDNLYQYIGEIIAKKNNGNADVTFKEAKIACLMTATCFSERYDDIHVFSNIHTPDMPIRSAIRASAAFPVLFLPATINNKLWYDGGMICNFPLRLIDRFYPQYAENAIALRLCSNPNKQNNWTGGFVDMLFKLLSIVVSRTKRLEECMTNNMQRCIYIKLPPRHNFKVTDMREVTFQEIIDLIMYVYNSQ